MNRRLAGMVVVLLAVVAVVVAPSIDGRRVAGAAIALTFPDPPRVGDCVLPPFPVDAGGSGVPAQIPVTAITFGPCDGVIAGEVVGVWPSVAQAATVMMPRGGGPCYRPLATFAGLEFSGRSTDLPGAPPAGPVSWKPSLAFEPFAVVPGVVEQRAGRGWTACLAVPAQRPGYRGTLRAAYSTGALPVEFGSCWTGTDLDRLPAPVHCDRPHPAELVATGFVLDRVQAPTEVIDGSCEAIAGRIMHSRDPTRGGRLKIVADRVTGDVASRPDAPLSLGCFVTVAGAQQLSGTVVGLGDRPVPFAE